MSVNKAAVLCRTNPLRQPFVMILLKVYDNSSLKATLNMAGILNFGLYSLNDTTYNDFGQEIPLETL